jgi:long-chain fatty acid transport protein
MTQQQKATKLFGSFTAALLLSTTVAHASGFALNEQSAASVGMALAGTGVENDASVQFSNPAGISALQGFNALGGGNIYFTDATFHNHGSVGPAGTPLTGNATTDPTIAAPDGYIAYTMDNGVSLGLGLYSPYGLATYYPDTSSVRYFAQSTDLRTIEINPNIAYKLDKELSIGAGPEIRWSRGEFSQAVDYGAGVFAATAPRVAPFGPTALAALAAATGPGGANDLRIHAVGDDWSVGYKLGTLWTPDDKTKVAVAYHSAMESTLSGTGSVDTSGLSKNRLSAEHHPQRLAQAR